ncbi:MAG TPA: EAL domain-containing protein [Pyrinomonadaceae bacterium]|jgi:diguanylate cyclase (GGDEF)-like protein/PAS domain S-box-containing protein|nr:EAL domain-containing protein [Pyrinomonadaceae bacterium]
MIQTYPRRPATTYALLVFAAGAAALTLSLTGSTHVPTDARYLLLCFCAMTVGTRFYLKPPRANLVVPLYYFFGLLAALAYDAYAAIPLVAASALASSLRLGRRGGLVVHDSALAAAAMLAAGWAAGQLGVFMGAEFVSAPALLALTLAVTQAAAETAPTYVYAPKGGDSPGLRNRLASFAWGATAYMLPMCVALLVAQFVRGDALDTFVWAATALSLAHALYLDHKRARASETPQRFESGSFAAPANAAVADDYYAAFNYTAIGMAVLSDKGKLLWVNQSLCLFLGYRETDLIGTSLNSITRQEDLVIADAALKSMLEQQKDLLQLEVRHQRRDGEQVWALWNVARYREPSDEQVYLLLQLQDITERRQSEEKLRHDAFHDPLTGLPNRALFADHVKLTIARAKRAPHRYFAILFCDLDRFKVINDSLGHMVGDQLLAEVARRLEKCLREGDTVARVGGDEFTILLEDLDSEAEAEEVANRIQEEVTAPILLDGREVYTTMSIGLVTGNGDSRDPEDLLRDADTAMYHAKSLGKARHVIFDQTMHASAINLLQIETDLRKALDKGQFFLQYQPVVSLDDFRVCGFEALIRWHHPERGLISPLDFIPIAEETGQIIAIGEWALNEACRQMHRWEIAYPVAAPLFISVNLSCKQFNHPLLIEQVAEVIKRTRISPRRLKLEITESAVMDNIDSATSMLRQLRDIGVQLAIDDFGTGYSSLSYLHKFPIDTLKIDRSFVTRMAENPENIEIVRTIILLAQVLGMDVIAEGVETKEQLKILRDLKCEYGQGYYFSRPATAPDVEKIIIETDVNLRKTHIPKVAQQVVRSNVQALKVAPTE